MCSTQLSLLKTGLTGFTISWGT